MNTILTKYILTIESQKKARILKKVIYFIFALFLFVMVNLAQAESLNLAKGIKCETLNGEKSFIIRPNSISFITDENENLNGLPQRSISSTIQNVRTQKMAKGFVKYTKYLGMNVKICLENLEGPSEINDYISMTSKEGHQITYPLICQ